MPHAAILGHRLNDLGQEFGRPYAIILMVKIYLPVNKHYRAYVVYCRILKAYLIPITF